MLRAFSVKPWLLFGFVVAASLAASCTEEGITSDCPPLPLYQTYPLGDASPADAASPDSGETQSAIAAAVDAGCLTAITNFRIEDTEGGAGGDAGDHAGAAGAR